MDVLTDAAQIDRAKLYAILAGSISVLYTLYRAFDTLKVLTAVKVPIIGAENFSIAAFWKARKRRTTGTEIWNLLDEGYQKYTQKRMAFRLPQLRRNHVMVDKDLIDEIKSLPESQVSFRKWAEELVKPRYSGMKSERSSAHLAVIRGDLTQKLAGLQPLINEEAEFAFKAELPYDETEFKSFYAYMTITRIVARVSARIFVGLPICRNEEWIKETVDFTISMFKLINRTQNWNPIVERLFAKFTNEWKVLKASQDNAIAILQPEIIRRRAEEQKAKESGHAWISKPNDTLQWLEEKKDPMYVGDVRMHARAQLSLSMAAIHTSSMCATHCLYDIAARPELADELRAEMKQVLDRHHGIVSKVAMNEMVFLDSFMKECMRINNLGAYGMSRIVTAKNGITLSNGLHLPYNTLIGTPTAYQHTDPTLFPDPETFNPRRFLERGPTEPGRVPKNGFTHTSTEYLFFGLGTHACPGRFFAANEIKTMLVFFLAQYEVRLPPGTKRPENIKNGFQQMPNVMAQLEIKLRPKEERLAMWE